MKRGLAPCLQRTVIALVGLLFCLKVVHHIGPTVKSDIENEVVPQLLQDSEYYSKEETVHDLLLNQNDINISEDSKEVKLSEVDEKNDGEKLSRKEKQSKSDSPTKARDKELKQVVNATVNLVDWLVESSDSDATKDKYAMVKSMLMLWNPEASRWARNVSLHYRERMNEQGENCTGCSKAKQLNLN